MAQGQNPKPTLTQGRNYGLLLKEECLPLASEVAAALSVLNPLGEPSLELLFWKLLPSASNTKSSHIQLPSARNCFFVWKRMVKGGKSLVFRGRRMNYSLPFPCENVKNENVYSLGVLILKKHVTAGTSASTYSVEKICP